MARMVTGTPQPGPSTAVPPNTGASGDDIEAATAAARRIIQRLLPPIIETGTNTCERYIELLESKIRALPKIPGIAKIETVVFSIAPGASTPWQVNTGLTTGHEALRVTFVNGEVWYYDNGFFGGSDQIFMKRNIPAYATEGTPALDLTENLGGYLWDGWGAVWSDYVESYEDPHIFGM